MLIKSYGDSPMLSPLPQEISLCTITLRLQRRTAGTVIRTKSFMGMADKNISSSGVYPVYGDIRRSCPNRSSPNAACATAAKCHRPGSSSRPATHSSTDAAGTSRRGPIWARSQRHQRANRRYKLPARIDALQRRDLQLALTRQCPTIFKSISIAPMLRRGIGPNWLARAHSGRDTRRTGLLSS